MANESNSASIPLTEKIIYLIAVFLFWMNTTDLAMYTAKFLAAVPKPVLPSSAFYYLIMSILFLTVIHSGVYACIALIGGVSVIVFHYDSWIYMMLVSICLMHMVAYVIADQVFPWSSSWRILFSHRTNPETPPKL